MESPIERAIFTIAAERGIPQPVLQAALTDFLKAMHEGQVKVCQETGSVLTQIYRHVGSEAAYHFGGVLIGDGEMHDPSEIHTELQYLDSRLKRFRGCIEQWEMEKVWDREDSASDES